MKKYALLCVLMSIMSSAYAFEWVKISEDEKSTMFFDAISLREASQNKMPNKIYWEKYIIPSEMRVTHIKREIDCKNYRHRILEGRFYDISETKLLAVDKEVIEWMSINKNKGVGAELCELLLNKK